MRLAVASQQLAVASQQLAVASVQFTSPKTGRQFAMTWLFGIAGMIRTCQTLVRDLPKNR